MRHRVELDKGFLERLKTAPHRAVSELIWNAMDADADAVNVEFDRQEMGGVELIRVADDGHGMTADEAIEAFRRLGGSWKAGATATRGEGRALHGKEGRGRFFAAALGTRTRWRSVSERSGERRLTVIEIRRATIDDVEIEDRGLTDAALGTVVEVEGFSSPPRGIEGPRAADAVLAEFAMHLTKYGVDLTYDDFPLDPRSLQTEMTTYDLESPDEEPAALDIVEWSRDVDRKMFLCNAGGTALADVAPGIHAPGFDFTAYVRWDGFASDSVIDLPDLSAGPTADVVDAARDRLRAHFKQRAEDRRRDIIERWKREEVYPYTDQPADEVEQTSRELFDVVAVTARDAIGEDQRTQRFTLRLLREALERDPGHLRRVLEEVLDLDDHKLADLNALLDRTSLAAMVAVARSITDRLDFLRALEEMVFEPAVKGRVLERTQLHRMLATETWVFGEEYHLVADDESLTNVLRRHLRYLERCELAPAPVTDEQGRTRIVDLMLAKSLEEAQNRREHLVIELKAPSVNIGHKELDQIRDYATAVAKDPQFDKATTRWDFWIVSTDMKEVAHRQASQRNREPGLVDEYDDLNVRIWAETWGQITRDARHRLKFLRGQLDYTSSRDEAVEYLHRRHADFVPEPLRTEEEGAADDGEGQTAQ